VSSADFDVIYYYSSSHFLFFGQISNYWAGQGPPPVGVVRQATWTAPPSFIAKAKENAKANEVQRRQRLIRRCNPEDVERKLVKESREERQGRHRSLPGKWRR
jgi:hypothetical protein